jgi:hypothetical protein
MGLIVDKSIQEKYILAIDDKIRDAGKIMGMEDLSDEESEDDGVYDTVYEERFHCGVCTVRTVMEVVWPSVDDYMNYLEGLIRGYENMSSSAYSKLKPLLTSIPVDQQETFLSVLADLNTEPEVIAEEPKS